MTYKTRKITVVNRLLIQGVYLFNHMLTNVNICCQKHIFTMLCILLCLISVCEFSSVFNQAFTFRHNCPRFHWH